MEKRKQIRKQLGQLFRSQNLAALSTQSSGQPYASLIAFYATPDLKHIYFATPKTTRKFDNLSRDSRVALFINNSTNQASDFHQAIAVTAVGKAEEVREGNRGDADSWCHHRTRIWAAVHHWCTRRHLTDSNQGQNYRRWIFGNCHSR